jgi:type I restriction enzyme R subunit
LNPKLPADALEDALRTTLRTESPLPHENNRRFHQLLTHGVDVQYRNAEGRVIHDKAWLVDFDDAARNDWLVVNQYTVLEGQQNRRPDVVVFVNGLPLAVLELKNAADETATIRSAFHQLQTYKHDIPSLFPFNAVLVVSDGLEARMGTLTGDWERFLPWRTIDGRDVAPKGTPELEVMVKGVFEPARFLDLLRSFIVFEVDGAKVTKKVAGYHQFHAVRKAVDATVRASSPEGDRRVGVVWHTQGSGKSLSMVFYAARLARTPAMQNPTLVVLTDRNDLDDQLFGTFSLCTDLLRQTPVQAENRAELRELLKVASGGVVFTTIQKFAPSEKGEKYELLSDRKNIVVVCDEAHRSQYDFIDGFARHMRDALPNASFLGFTGTPIEAADKSTPAVFGDYIDVYDIQRAVEDGATVRIYYEGRMARLELDEEEKPTLDDEFDEVTEGEEEAKKERLKSKWARLEAMVGAEKRIARIASDIVEHFERRLEAMDGKAMVVCMSRRICVDLYDAIAKLRPDWHDPDDLKGVLKVVMTGSADDKPALQPHIRNKARREALAKRYKNADDDFKLVIVRDMWLTGFDAPCMHTMYADKPMRGHGLMQAIARVNRVFRDKPGGLVVDYLGIADQLKRALSEYTEGDRREAGVPQEEAAAVMQEKFEVVASMMHGFDYSKAYSDVASERIAVLPNAMQHVLAQDDGKARYLKAVTDLSKAFALAVPHEDAIAVRDDVGFFQAVRAALAKNSGTGKDPDDLDHAVRQLVSKAVSSTDIVDIFAAAGLKSPDISILSDEFLVEVRGMPQKNLALELLKRLLNDEIKSRAQKNVVQSRSFSEMLEKTMRAYQNRSIETAQVITELIEMAKDMKAAKSRGEQLHLTDDEVAFYDALETNDSAVNVLGDDTLRTIARELVETVRRNVTIDWTVKDSARAKLRTLVKRVLRKYGYPPDKQERAVQTVLEQAEVLCRDWAA